MTDPAAKSESDGDEGSQSVSFGDYLAVRDVGNNGIYGKIKPYLPELYSVLHEVAAAEATNFLPPAMSEAIGEHMVDGECVYQTAVLCGCLAQLDDVDEFREDSDESSGTWPYFYYSANDTEGVVNELRNILRRAIDVAPKN